MEVANRAGLNIARLDRMLAYLHSARSTADKNEWMRLMKTMSEMNLVVAQVDYLPEILVDDILQSISKLGFDDILAYTDFDELVGTYSIQYALANDETILRQPGRIETADQSIRTTTDFDQRFSYLSSTVEKVNQIIRDAELEGFFCNENTKADWSFINQTENQIDWNSPERHQDFK